MGIEKTVKDLKMGGDTIAKAQRVDRYSSHFKNFLIDCDKIKSVDRDLLGEYERETKGKYIGKWLLGRGGFSSVYLVLDSNTQDLFCVKLHNKTEVDSLGIDMEKRVERERELGEIYSPYLLPVRGLFANLAMYGLKLDFFPGVGLNRIWNDLTGWNLEGKIGLLVKITGAIKTLHLNEWVHRDIHPSNVLIDILDSYDIQVIDFNLSKPGGGGHSAAGYGHSDSIPPEARKTGAYDSAGDVWAFGALAFKLLTGTGVFENVVSNKRAEDFPKELDADSRKAFASALSELPQERPNIAEIHRAITSWLRKFSRQCSQTFHKELLTCLSSPHGNLKMVVETEHENAHIYFKDEALWEAEYGEMRGRDALREICEDALTLYGLKMDSELIAPPPENPDLHKLNLQGFILEHSRLSDTIGKGREMVKNLVRQDILEIEDEIVCRAPKCVSDKTHRRWEGENLECATDVFLYSDGNRYQLKPWCRECIIRHGENARRRKGRLATPYRGYDIAYLGQNYYAEFYLGFKGGDIRIFNLYIKPPQIKEKTWMAVLKRIKRGHEIMGRYPSCRFIRSRHFAPVKSDEQKFGILSWDYFPAVTLRQALDCEQEEIDFTDVAKYAILLETAEALDALHRKGVIHRNVNPSSILLGVNGQTRLSDFSLCKYEPGSEDEDFYAVSMNLTRQYPFGVLNYLSPEHLGKMSEAGKSSDVWSWAIVACEMFAGVPPFKRNQSGLTMAAINKEKPNLSTLPGNLRKLVERALDKYPQNRPTAGETAKSMWKLLSNSFTD